MASAPAALTPAELQQNQAPGLYALFTIFLVLPLVAVTLRLVSRRLAHLPLWWDDWLVVVGAGCAIAQFVFLLEAIANGMGQHVQVVPPEDIRRYLMWTYASEIYYGVTVTLVKCSVLCLYLRLFGVKPWFVRTCYALLAFVAAWGIAILFSTVFQCTPVAAAWDTTIRTAADTRCIDLRAWLIGNNVPNILADITIIALPVPLLWSLQLSLMRRLGLVLVFLLASIATIISIIRVTANASIDVTDPTWGYVATAEFSTIEANTAIMTACLPVLPPLVRFCAGRRAVSTNRSGQRESRAPDLSHGSALHSWRSTTKVSRQEEDEDHLFALPSRGGAGGSGNGSGVTTAGGQGEAVSLEQLPHAVPLGQIHVRNDTYLETHSPSQFR